MHLFILSENGLTFIYILDKVVGFIYNNSRYYDSETCRFISPDVISIIDKVNEKIHFGYSFRGYHKDLDEYKEKLGKITILSNVHLGVVPYVYYLYEGDLFYGSIKRVERGKGRDLQVYSNFFKKH